MDNNPFSAPQVDVAASDFMASGSFFRLDNAVVVTNEAELPHRCIRCNVDLTGDGSGKRTTRKIYYAHPLIYLTLFINVLVLLLLWVIVPKPVQVSYSMCSRHVRQRWVFAGLAIGWLLTMVVSVAVFQPVDALAGIMVIGVIGFLVLIVLAARGLTARKKVDDQFWIYGFGKPFLEGLGSS